MEKSSSKTVPQKREPRTTYVTNDIPYSENMEYAENAIKRLVDKLRETKKQQRLSGQAMADKLSPYVSSPNALTRITTIWGKDKRLPSLELAFVMRRVFGISLDAIADGYISDESKLLNELLVWIDKMPKLATNLADDGNDIT